MLLFPLVFQCGCLNSISHSLSTKSSEKEATQEFPEDRGIFICINSRSIFLSPYLLIQCRRRERCLLKVYNTQGVVHYWRLQCYSRAQVRKGSSRGTSLTLMSVSGNLPSYRPNLMVLSILQRSSKNPSLRLWEEHHQNNEEWIWWPHVTFHWQEEYWTKFPWATLNIYPKEASEDELLKLHFSCPLRLFSPKRNNVRSNRCEESEVKCSDKMRWLRTAKLFMKWFLTASKGLMVYQTVPCRRRGMWIWGRCCCLLCIYRLLVCELCFRGKGWRRKLLYILCQVRELCL